jgi:hypothetical protein
VIWSPGIRAYCHALPDKTAKALGLTISEPFLLTADEVIEWATVILSQGDR